MAEKEGFEPQIELPLQLMSSQFCIFILQYHIVLLFSKLSKFCSHFRGDRIF